MLRLQVVACSFFLVVFGAAAVVPAQESGEEESEASDEEGSSFSGWGVLSGPTDAGAADFAELLGQSWGSQHGCEGEWKVVWKVEGGSFSLVPGTGGDMSGAAAHHAVCESYRSVGEFAGPKVGLTVIGGAIRRVAVLPAGTSGAAERKSKIAEYFKAVCETKDTEPGAEAYATLYRDCDGFDVGLAAGSSDLSIYLFDDQSSFRNRMNALPMPTGPED